jgi:predicted dehydrogenase
MNGRGVAILGAGVVGEMRARTVVRHPGLRLRGVADVDPERARRVASLAAGAAGEVAVSADYGDLLEAARVDVVIVSSPVHLHEEMAVAALARGKDVLVEKPLSNSVESCRRILEAAAAARRTLAVGFNHRYYPSFRFLRQLVDEGALGPVDHVRAFGGHEGMSQFRAPWMYEQATLGGGAMMDVGIHVTDLVQFLGFRARQVTAATSNRVWRVAGSEDNAIVLARTADDIPITYQATWSEWKGYRLRVEVYGQQGMALAHYPPLLNLIWRRTADGRRRRSWKLSPAMNVRERLRGWQVTAEEAFAAELADFLRLLDGGQASCATGLDGLRAVAFAAAAVRSSSIGGPVTVEP